MARQLGVHPEFFRGMITCQHTDEAYRHQILTDPHFPLARQRGNPL
jgi:hypothetical protein